mmetsp:Transcript_55460/g.91415  ORF Transcript_55460/g.91415 Transcript_55460/m.91415 type:complete len:213 (+) Transcript_55460:193-831(+)
MWYVQGGGSTQGWGHSGKVACGIQYRSQESSHSSTQYNAALHDYRTPRATKLAVLQVRGELIIQHSTLFMLMTHYQQKLCLHRLDHQRESFRANWSGNLLFGRDYSQTGTAPESNGIAIIPLAVSRHTHTPHGVCAIVVGAKSLRTYHRKSMSCRWFLRLTKRPLCVCDSAMGLSGHESCCWARVGVCGLQMMLEKAMFGQEVGGRQSFEAA